MTLHISEIKNHTLLLTPNAQGLGLLGEHFNPAFLAQEELITNTANGRGLVYFFKVADENVVLRHYKRGGLIAKISSDKFIFRDIAHSRCFEELTVLQHLRKANVNVPVPIGGRVTRQGVFYTADIITGLINDAVELHEILQLKRLSTKAWEAVGVQIRKMHNAQVFHGDINVKNVLLSQSMDTPIAHLLDFDKCNIKQGNAWKEANLLRFKRSLLKQLNKLETYNYSAENWDELLSAYKNA